MTAIPATSPPRRLRTLVCTARLGNVNAAAAALNLTQGAVSQQLKRLERDYRGPRRGLPDILRRCTCCAGRVATVPANGWPPCCATCCAVPEHPHEPKQFSHRE